MEILTMEGTILQALNEAEVTPPGHFDEVLAEKDVLLFSDIKALLKALEKNFVQGWKQGDITSIALYPKDYLSEFPSSGQQAVARINTTIIEKSVDLIKVEGEDFFYPIFPEKGNTPVDKLPNFKNAVKQIFLSRKANTVEIINSLPEEIQQTVVASPGGLAGYIRARFGIPAESI